MQAGERRRIIGEWRKNGNNTVKLRCNCARMSIRKLAKETAIYGVSSIVGRMLYFLLTPIYTRVLPNPGEYGIATDLFAFTALLMVFFTYRMETAYFRFGSEADEGSAEKSFNTALWSIVGSSLVFGAILFLLSDWLADLFQYPDKASLVRMCALILTLDALCEIPYARLRLESRPIRFAAIRLISIGVNLGLNLFFLLICPWLQTTSWGAGLVSGWYDPHFSVGYIFVSNVVASLVALLLLSPIFFRLQWQFDRALWRRMALYAAPLVIVGFSYVINETLDRKIMIWFLPGTSDENQAQLGIYGANYKLAMLISLFTQAFRYGAEPFFFKQKNTLGVQKLYADVARFFLIAGMAAFLFIVLYIDAVKYFIGPDYWVGLGVVPILTLANVFLGMYYNFSVWYKVTDKTRWGAYISIGGALITIGLNIWWIPIFGYYGSAWTTLICYATMALACYFTGKRFYDVPYDLKTMALYLAVGIVIWQGSDWLRVQFPEALIIRLALNTVVLAGLAYWVFIRERSRIRNYFKF